VSAPQTFSLLLGRGEGEEEEVSWFLGWLAGWLASRQAGRQAGQETTKFEQFRTAAWTINSLAAVFAVKAIRSLAPAGANCSMMYGGWGRRGARAGAGAGADVSEGFISSGALGALRATGK